MLIRKICHMRGFHTWKWLWRPLIPLALLLQKDLNIALIAEHKQQGFSTSEYWWITLLFSNHCTVCCVSPGFFQPLVWLAGFCRLQKEQDAFTKDFLCMESLKQMSIFEKGWKLPVPLEKLCSATLGNRRKLWVGMTSATPDGQPLWCL